MAEEVPFVQGVQQRFKFYLQDPLKHLSCAKIGYSALEAFLQAHCTGPPLDFDSVKVIVPEAYRQEWPKLKAEMFRSLSVDGIDIYPLTARIELFWLAKCMLDNETLAEEGFNGRRARLRVNFWHQKLLAEQSDTLRSLIYHDATVLETQMSSRLVHGGAAAQEHMVEFFIERANIRIFFGDEVLAREDLLRAARLRGFSFALTGAMGKRTRFQENDTSQLVVLAKSRDHEPEPYTSRRSSRIDQGSRKSSAAEPSVKSLSKRPMTPVSPDLHVAQASPTLPAVPSPHRPTEQPHSIPLNDDTLWESIQFQSVSSRLADPTTEVVTDQTNLPVSLAYMDAGDQPKLFPVDSIILLAIATSITNTQASDGLTREETLPYANRVLDGGSSNWAIYSQALLVRSRIEGYRSRTAERGLLQLQALVDQVIAETNGKEPEARTDGSADSASSQPSTFFPKAKEEEMVTVAGRLRFVHQLHPPFRWELESELAARWTSMGGLKTALEIYERLQMHSEAILCLAATDQEAEAISRLKNLLFTAPEQEIQHEDLTSLRNPLPPETPRLLCILGEIQQEPKYFELAWIASNKRYARAQRSIGKLLQKKRDYPAAITAYTAALRIARQDMATWFSLGCLQLEVEDWQAAVESFTRVVQLEDRDAQGWSNLAVALLRLPPPIQSPFSPDPEIQTLETVDETKAVDHDINTAQSHVDPLQHTFEALQALRRAAQLKREDARIWDNYLTVAASIPPDPERPERGTPWQEIVNAIGQVITLRQKKEGEGCVDLKILDALITYVTAVYDYPSAETTEERNGAVQPPAAPAAVTPDLDSSLPAPTESTNNDNVTTVDATPRLPFLVRSVSTLLDTQITPLATSSSTLYLILSRYALWRHRPHESLSLVEKSWRATTNKLDVKAAELVEATVTLVDAYRTLGPLERERTGGVVEKGWRFKSRSAVRSVQGKVGGMDDVTEGDGNLSRLETLLEELKV